MAVGGTWTAPVRGPSRALLMRARAATKPRCSRSTSGCTRWPRSRSMRVPCKVRWEGRAVGATSLLRRDRGGGQGAWQRARQPASRVARHHRRRRHRQPADTLRGVGDRERDRRAGLPATVVNPLDHPGGEFAVMERRRSRARRHARGPGALDRRRMRSSPACRRTPPRPRADLFEELRHQYLITFEPGTRPGWHPLEIRTRNKT